MHKVICAAVSILWLALPCAAQPHRPIMSPAEIVNGVMEVRRLFLRDSTPIDYCSFGDLFGLEGVLPRARGMPPARYSTLRECAAADPTSRTSPWVEVLRSSATVDTVVIHGISRHGGLSLVEEYRFHQPRGARHWVPLYRIVGFMER